MILCVCLLASTIPLCEGTIFYRSYLGITDITTQTIPSGTTQAAFEDNAISFIPCNYFANLPSLAELSLKRNVISGICDYAFSQVQSLTLLGVAFNSLQVVTRNMFARLPNLLTLKLRENLIHSIEPGL